MNPLSLLRLLSIMSNKSMQAWKTDRHPEPKFYITNCRQRTSLSTGNKLRTSCSSKREAMSWPPAASHGVRAIEIPTTRNNKDDSCGDIMPCR